MPATNSCLGFWPSTDPTSAAQHNADLGALLADPAEPTFTVRSDLNSAPGTTVTYLVVVELSGTGTFSVYNYTGSADMIFDVEGYFGWPGDERPPGLMPRGGLHTGSTCLVSTCREELTLPSHGRGLEVVRDGEQPCATPIRSCGLPVPPVHVDHYVHRAGRPVVEGN